RHRRDFVADDDEHEPRAAVGVVGAPVADDDRPAGDPSAREAVTRRTGGDFLESIPASRSGHKASCTWGAPTDRSISSLFPLCRPARAGTPRRSMGAVGAHGVVTKRTRKNTRTAARATSTE